MRRTIEIKKDFKPLVVDSLDIVFKEEKFEKVMSVKTEESIDVRQYKKDANAIIVNVKDTDEKTEIGIKGDRKIIEDALKKLAKRINDVIEGEIIKKL
jgi:ERCC4-related helicase